MRYIFILCFTLIANLSVSQDINQTNSQGERHGVWKKNFEGTEVLRYEGEFNQGQEVGTFKFYKNIDGQSVLTATRTYRPNSDLAAVKFYASTKHLISEGNMKGKIYVGKWVYYHNKSKAIMTEEFYNTLGELEGPKKTYYLSGQLAQVDNYSSGVLNGESRSYSEFGNLIKIYSYVNGELHGPAKIYDASGIIQMEGVYQKDRRHGIWKFYKNGTLESEKDFTRRSKNPRKN